MCVRGISQESEQVMYMCLRDISQESERSCICVLGISNFPISTIFLFNFWNFSDSVIFFFSIYYRL